MGQGTGRIRMAYGLAGFSMMLPDLLVMQWLIVRYLPPHGPALVPPMVFGVVVFAGRMIEGLSCPVAGHMSDHLRHPWGRRMPFMRLGIGPFLAAFALMFLPPAGWGPAAAGVSLMTAAAVYFLLYSAVFTPYLSLLADLTSHARERVNLTTAQAVAMFFATVVFALMGLVLEQGGWRAFVALATVLILVAFLPACTLIKEPRRETSPGTPFLTAARSALSNGPFWNVLLSTSFFFYAINGILLLVPYWAVCYLGGGEGDVPLLMGPYLGANLIFFFVFNALEPRMGKYRLLLWVYLGGAVSFGLISLIGFFPWGSPLVQTMGIMALAGIPVAGFMVLPFAVLSDVVDYETRRTGQQRAAIFFGLQAVVQKLMLGLSVLTFSVVPYLGASGGEDDGGEGATVFGLRVTALLCAASCVLAWAAFRRYPIRERRGAAYVSGVEAPPESEEM